MKMNRPELGMWDWELRHAKHEARFNAIFWTSITWWVIGGTVWLWH